MSDEAKRVVSEVLTELDRDDPDPRRLSEVIATDPGLTARLLKLANSAFFGLTRQIDSVDEAIQVKTSIFVASHTF